jgi:hypothetical protein
MKIKKKIWGMILKIPAVLLLVGALIVGIYAYAKGIGGIKLATPIIIAVIDVLYFIGEYMQLKEEAW